MAKTADITVIKVNIADKFDAPACHFCNLRSMLHCRVERISDLSFCNFSQAFFDKLVVYFFLDKRARASTTDLTVVYKCGHMCRVNRIIHCKIIE